VSKKALCFIGASFLHIYNNCVRWIKIG